MRDIVILLCLAGIFFIPTKGQPKPTEYKYSIDSYQTMAAEGEFAILFNLPSDKKHVTVDTHNDKVDTSGHPSYCKCGGTGHVKSGDGIIDVPCPCGNHCECKPPKTAVEAPSVELDSVVAAKAPSPPETKKNAIETMPEPKKEEKKLHKQVVMLASKGCRPCLKFKRNYAEQLKKEGYGFDDKEDSLIRVVNFEDDEKLYEELSQSMFIPQFLLLEDGKVTKWLTGYQDVNTIKNLLK